MGTIIDMNKICRICLEEGSLTSIYNHEYAVSPAEMIHFCSTIKISNDDGLPLSICSNCVYRLRITYEFVQQCETSDIRLKQYVRYELDINSPTLNNNIGKEDNHNNLRTPLIDTDNDATLREKNEIYAAMNVVCEFLGNTHNNENNEIFLRSQNSNIEKHNSNTEHHNCLLGVTNNVISSNNNVSNNNINDNNNDNDIIINNSNNNNEIIESTYLMSNVLAESILNNTRKLNVIQDEHELDINTVDQCAAEEKINIGKRMKRKITKKRNIRPLKTKADLDKFLAQQKYKKKSQKLSHTSKVKMLTVRERLKMPDKCLDCGKTFSYSGYLEAHMRTHTGERPYHCEQCNLKFSQAGNLALHMRVHTGERPYQCEICSKLFTTSSNLKAHQRIHSEIRDFKCTQCYRAFKSVTELQSHEGTHTGVKNHICGICGKAFYKTSYMNVHIRTVHIGEKKHRCSECGKVFSNSSNLTCHFRIHTGEKPFSCKICDARFNQSSALIRHTKQHKEGVPKKQFKISSTNSKETDRIQQDDEQPIQTLLQDIHSTSITDYHHQHEYNKLLSSNDTTFTTNYFKFSDSSVVTSVSESLPSFTKNCVEYSRPTVLVDFAKNDTSFEYQQ